MRFTIQFIASVILVAFATQFEFALTVPGGIEHSRQILPAYGAALGVVLVGGHLFLIAVFLGALIPSMLFEESLLTILSLPVGLVVAARSARLIVDYFKLRIAMDRVRDTAILLFLGFSVAACLGTLVQSMLLYIGDPSVVTPAVFGSLWAREWLATMIGMIVVAPFIMTWTDCEGYRLSMRQAVEIVLWIVILLLFAGITFKNWLPTDTLLYPMELAIFPIMAWASVRFGLIGASAGALLLMMTAVWELIIGPSAGLSELSQSEVDNVWIFLMIVSVTSIMLATVMTEIRRREMRIAENESRLSAFTGGLPDIAFVLNRSGRIEDVFASSEEIEANHRLLSAGSARGKQLKDVFKETIAGDMERTTDAALRSGRVETLEYAMDSDSADVGTHFFEARVSPMPATEGVPNSVVWVAYDITARKESEQAINMRDRILHASAKANAALLIKSDFSEAVDSALWELSEALGVDRGWVFEIEPRVDAQFRSVSVRFEYKREENMVSILSDEKFINARFEESFPDWDKHFYKDGALRVIKGGAVKDDYILREFGSSSLLAVPVWVERSLHGFLIFDYVEKVHDWIHSEVSAIRVLATSICGLILIRRREEELYRSYDKADAASLAKGEFLAVMSHEIRTPMNAIVGYTDLLCQSSLNTAQEGYVAIIKRSSRALLDLINNILDYSKIESRKMELVHDEFDIEQISCEALEYSLPMAKEKGIRLDYNIGPNVGEIYVGDGHRIRQILLNLVTNAVKFTDKGSVELRIDVLDEKEGALVDTLRFDVIDTGRGIPEEKYGCLFQTFSQIDSSTTREFDGTGLGLVICERLVQRMDGWIGFESEYGEGSTFSFILRLQQPEQLRKSLPPFAINRESGFFDPEFASKHPMRIVVCEDDKDNRYVIKEILEQLGYVADISADAEELMLLLRNRRYDAILMDIRLPKQSGLELTSLIRRGGSNLRGSDQYIIAITAYAMQEDREKCLRAGMDDYLSKPFVVRDFKEALSRAHQVISEKGALS